MNGLDFNAFVPYAPAPAFLLEQTDEPHTKSGAQLMGQNFHHSGALISSCPQPSFMHKKYPPRDSCAAEGKGSQEQSLFTFEVLSILHLRLVLFELTETQWTILIIRCHMTNKDRYISMDQTAYGIVTEMAASRASCLHLNKECPQKVFLKSDRRETLLCG